MKRFISAWPMAAGFFFVMFILEGFSVHEAMRYVQRCRAENEEIRRADAELKKADAELIAAGKRLMAASKECMKVQQDCMSALRSRTDYQPKRYRYTFLKTIEADGIPLDAKGFSFDWTYMANQPGKLFIRISRQDVAKIDSSLAIQFNGDQMIPTIPSQMVLYGIPNATK